MAKIHKGVGISEGYVIGEAYIDKSSEVTIRRIQISGDHSAREVARFLEAVEQVADLISREVRVQSYGGHASRMADLEVELLFLGDQDLLDEVSDKIENILCNAEYAIDRIFAEKIAVLENIDDETLETKADSLRNVRRRLLNVLAGRREFETDPGEAKIMVTEELQPGMVLNAREHRIVGFVTERGGETSHAAILARAFDIPVIMGVERARQIIREGEALLLDSATGSMIRDMDAAELESYGELCLEQEERRSEFQRMIDREPETADGVPYQLAANLVSNLELKKAIRNRAQGIGLLRTEFLFMKSRSLPDEQTQFAVYREVVEAMKGHPVIIRTLDAGGDKVTAGIDYPSEDNPFMGWRAIRVLLDRPDLFRTQLRAIYRASAYGTVRILLPMVISVDEITRTKVLIRSVKEELRQEGYPFDNEVQLGIMVETPASIFILDQLLEEADFASIGTNDLTQYLLAVDRTNNRLSHYYDHGHPAVLRAIREVCRIAREKNAWVGVCGEMAGQSKYAPFLLGCGVDQLSVSPAKINRVKNELSKVTMDECRQLAEEI